MPIRSSAALSLLLLGALFVASLAGCTARPSLDGPPDAMTPLRVISYNVRFNNPGDGINAWPERRDRVAALLRFHEADLIGVQEALAGQLDDLDAALPGHAWLGVGRDDGATTGEYTAIFYRTDRLELLDEGTFWLSPTPSVPGSVGWDAAITRIATWARFRDLRTGTAFVHLNTHFDHVGAEARTESARLIVDWLGGVDPATPVRRAHGRAAGRARREQAGAVRAGGHVLVVRRHPAARATHRLRLRPRAGAGGAPGDLDGKHRRTLSFRSSARAGGSPVGIPIRSVTPGLRAFPEAAYANDDTPETAKAQLPLS